MKVSLDEQLAKLIGRNRLNTFEHKIEEFVEFMDKMCKEIINSEEPDSEINTLLYETMECTISMLVNFLMPSNLHRDFYEKLYKNALENNEKFRIALKLAETEKTDRNE